MADGIQTITITDQSANPAPLGLLAFGTTTVLLNLQNAGIFPLGTMILAMGLFYGGLAQIFAGWMEWKKGNTFGLTAFLSYGLFWETLVFLILMGKGHWGWFDAASEGGMVAYLLIWGLFTFVMWIASLKHPKAAQVVFLSLWILFVLLAWHDATGNATIGLVAGWEGIFCGFSAIYLAAAQILNETYGRTMLPIG